MITVPIEEQQQHGPLPLNDLLNKRASTIALAWLEDDPYHRDIQAAAIYLGFRKCTGCGSKLMYNSNEVQPSEKLLKWLCLDEQEQEMVDA